MGTEESVTMETLRRILGREPTASELRYASTEGMPLFRIGEHLKEIPNNNSFVVSGIYFCTNPRIYTWCYANSINNIQVSQRTLRTT